MCCVLWVLVKFGRGGVESRTNRAGGEVQLLCHRGWDHVRFGLITVEELVVRVLTGVGNPLCYPFGCHYYYYIKNCSKTHVSRVSHTHRQMLWFANAGWDIMSSMWLDFGWIWSVYVSLVVCIKKVH